MMIDNSQRRSTARGIYRPLTREDLRPQSESDLFAGLESTSSRTLGGLLFAVIFVLSNNLLAFSGLLMVILLVCLLYRMDSRERRIAAIPLTFGTVRMALSLTVQLHANAFLSNGFGNTTPPQTLVEALHWMPILFAVYLFYSPWKDSNTSRLIFWYSVVLLLSGLIPGEGYLVIPAVLFYTLFFAIAVALVLDFSSPKPTQRPSAAIPTPPQQPPQAQAAF